MSQWLDKFCWMPSYITRALTAKDKISSSFEDYLRNCFGKHFAWPARQSPTTLTYTLSVKRPWCLPWTATHWSFYPYCCWFWHNFYKHFLLRDKQTRGNQYISVCLQNYYQKLSHVGWSAGNRSSKRFNWWGYISCSWSPPKRSRDQQWKLTPCVCCWYLFPQHQDLR
jgi:hypothetical protein